MPNLYIVATPIGNLEDISKRVLRVLEEVDLILCEDTRNTQKLLNHFEIKTKTLSYHHHSKIRKIDHILEKIKQGNNIALVSDAGTPGVSDPGAKLVEKIIESDLDVKIVSVPGPSALIAAFSVSGISSNKFLFLGFCPAKKKRKKFFEEVSGSKYPVILYESPHRILKTLKELEETSSKFEIVVCRELTKMFETIYRGKVEEVLKEIQKEKPRGEFVIIIKK